MPRKRKTQPGPGGAYANRTDLTQPVSAPTGLPYGQRQAMEQAQQQTPLPQQTPMDQILKAAGQHSFAPVPLNAPTDRPYEPITHGLPTGAGGGPEVLQRRTNTTSMQLKQLAASTGDNAIADMATRLERLGL
jgi:hypothetical protein